MNTFKIFTYGAVLTVGSCLGFMLLAGCSSEPVGGVAHLPVYHQAPGQPSPADQAAAAMARRQYGVKSASNTQGAPASISTKP